MPYVMRKIKNENLYTVKNKDTGKIHARATTKDKAKAMIRILAQAESRGNPRPQAELDIYETIWKIICHPIIKDAQA
jgi:hypothetical protein